jgi:5-formyltetrahydrofolate cyclo-ligase
MSVKEAKNSLRKALKISSRAAAREADGVVLKIESLPEFTSASTIALYCSLPDEPSTTEMLRRWQCVKRLALPVITRDGEMTFREYTAPESLTPGPYGIHAPHEGREIPPQEIDLMLVPGLAFDSAGRRLGRGKGYYDRYLAHPAAAHIHKVGLCHPEALIPEVPAEPHDIIMDKVVVA